MSWSRTKAETDLQTGRDRMNRWRAVLDNQEVWDAYEQVAKVILKEGNWIKAGRNPNADAANGRAWENERDSVEARVRFENALIASGAYLVSAEWATGNQNNNYDPETLDQIKQQMAADAAEHMSFWVKGTTSSAERVGKALETGSAAGIMDMLNYGFTNGSYSPTVAALWGQHSRAYARHAKGVVNVVVFEGVPDRCVLRDQEFPELLDRIKSGEVDHLHVIAIRRNSEGMIEEAGHYNVNTQEEFDALPRSERTDSYIVRQNHEFVSRNIARAIDRNVAGIQTSLDDFRDYFARNRTGSETQFFIAHPDGPGPILTQSPLDLSRYPTSSSAQSMPGISPSTLTEKLKAVDAEALQRRGSDTYSMFPARRASAVSPGSMGGFTESPYQVSAGTYAPQQTFPSTGGSDYFSTAPQPTFQYVQTPISDLPLRQDTNARGSNASTASMNSGSGASLERIDAQDKSEPRYSTQLGMSISDDSTRARQGNSEYHFVQPGYDADGKQFWAYKNNENGHLALLTFGNEQQDPTRTWTAYPNKNFDEWKRENRTTDEPAPSKQKKERKHKSSKR